MVNRYYRFGWTQLVAYSAAAFCVASATVHAQTPVVSYGTGFDGTDIVNGASVSKTYASPDYSNTYVPANGQTPATGPTAPLSSQNGWTSNDADPTTGRGTFAPSSTTQLNGGTTYVGALQSVDPATGAPITIFNGTQAGAVGGIYTATASTPVFAVPTKTTVTLAHPVTVPSGTSQVVFNTDFLVNANDSVGKDTFFFSLANAAGVSIFSFVMVPTSTASNALNITTQGATSTITPDALALNSTYHLKVTLTAGTTSTYTAVLSDPQSAGAVGTYTNTLSSPITDISQFAAAWKVTDTTKVNGGLTNSGDNFLAFDNLSISVPEPSTYAMLALGLAGMIGTACLRRRRA